MRIERKTTYHRKMLQFILGFFIGLALWGLTLIVLLVLN